MELELKHLSVYLPYGLKMAFIVREEIIKVGTLNNISINNSDTHPIRYSIDTLNELEHEWMFKPILRPLSDLTKEIEHNGEKFVPFHILKSKYGCDLTIDYQNIITFEDNVEGVEYYSYSVDVLDCYNLYQQLFEWHFDIFGLIEKGLAVDINTLNK